MSTVKILNSPQEVVDYINSITLPTGLWDVIDWGARYTVIEDVAGVWAVITTNDESELQFVLDGISGVLKNVVPHGEGGKFTFYSVDDVIAGVNALALTITVDEQSLEDALNTLVDAGLVVERVFEHDSKKLILSSPWDVDALAVFDRMPQTLLGSEQVAINNFIIAEKAATNWARYESLICPALLGDINAKTDWLGNFTYQEAGTLAHGVNGFNTAKGSLTTLEALNTATIMSQDDCWIGIKTKNAIHEAQVGYYFLSWNSVDQFVWRYTVLTRGDINPNKIAYGVNAGIPDHNYAGTVPTEMYIGCGRSPGSVGTMRLYQDGASLSSSATASNAMSDRPLGIPSFGGLQPLTFDFSFFCMGQWMNQAPHNTNVQALIAAL